MKKKGLTAILVTAMSMVTIFSSFGCLTSAGESEAFKLLGDVNQDGQVMLDDAQSTLKAALLIENLTEESKKLADYTQDGEVNLEDAQMVLKSALGIIDEVKIEILPEPSKSPTPTTTTPTTTTPTTTPPTTTPPEYGEELSEDVLNVTYWHCYSGKNYGVFEGKKVACITTMEELNQYKEEFLASFEKEDLGFEFKNYNKDALEEYNKNINYDESFFKDNVLILFSYNTTQGAQKYQVWLNETEEECTYTIGGYSRYASNVPGVWAPGQIVVKMVVSKAFLNGRKVTADAWYHCEWYEEDIS